MWEDILLQIIQEGQRRGLTTLEIDPTTYKLIRNELEKHQGDHWNPKKESLGRVSIQRGIIRVDTNIRITISNDLILKMVQ